MPPSPDIATINQGVYERPGLARWYSDWTTLWPVEEVVFAATASQWQGAKVLDIGIGGGRTCGFIAPDAGSYVGVDYSRTMVASAQARHPGLDLRHGDARGLTMFADGAFDFILFSFNGIDSVDDADRALILAEASRLLRPGGTFVFSSHNLDWSGNGRFVADMLRVTLSPSPVRTAKAFARVLVRARNYLRARKAYVRTERYMITPDAGDEFAAPHYYLGAAEAKRQLEAAGLEHLQTYDWTGTPVEAPPDTGSSSLYYVARKP